MKTLFFATVLVSNFIASTPIFAREKIKEGNSSGGGGHNYEIDVFEIRSDILKWIQDGGAKGLRLPKNLTYESYVSRMTHILQPNEVAVVFVDKDHSDDEELQVSIDGHPKTCRGFKSKKDNRFRIVCNKSEFKDTPASKRYRLIHHEYAGLVNVEKNVKSDSDYLISSQLDGFLTRQVVVKLAVKPTQNIAQINNCEKVYINFFDRNDSLLKNAALRIHKFLTSDNNQIPTDFLTGVFLVPHLENDHISIEPNTTIISLHKETDMTGKEVNVETYRSNGDGEISFVASKMQPARFLKESTLVKLATDALIFSCGLRGE